MTRARVRAQDASPVLVHRLERPVDALALAAQPDLSGAALVNIAGWQVVTADPLDIVTDLDGLSELPARFGWTDEPGGPAGPPFASGAVGFCTDDLSRRLLALDPFDRRPAVAELPPLRFTLHDAAVCVDPSGHAYVTAGDVPGLSHEEPTDRIERWRRRAALAAPLAQPEGAHSWRAAEPRGHAKPGPTGSSRPAQLSLDARAHAAAVAQAQQWIAAGDLYQLNLTLQATVAWPDGGAHLARRLLSASPGAAHAAWLRLPDADVVSVSPETFLRVRGGRVQTRPIKGTRPRGATAVEDRRQAEALLASGKDRAEHVMIVDLERNDLGRVCRTGTVRVSELAGLERHPTVWHLTSTVEGTLRDHTTIADLLAAMFPSGSVTGAPKRMAWERIAQLELLRRGVYCGAIGTITPAGLDLSVAIRTAVLAGDVASYGTGGAIVADSDADDEFQEAAAKAQAFLSATRSAWPRRSP